VIPGDAGDHGYFQAGVGAGGFGYRGGLGLLGLFGLVGWLGLLGWLGLVGWLGLIGWRRLLSVLGLIGLLKLIGPRARRGFCGSGGSAGGWFGVVSAVGRRLVFDWRLVFD
jgi:hypothetical protein